MYPLLLLLPSASSCLAFLPSPTPFRLRSSVPTSLRLNVDAVATKESATSNKLPFDQNYDFPSLDQETADMMDASSLVYAMAEIRRVALEQLEEQGKDRLAYLNMTFSNNQKRLGLAQYDIRKRQPSDDGKSFLGGALDFVLNLVFGDKDEKPPMKINGNPEEVLQSPLTAQQVLDFVEANQEILGDSADRNVRGALGRIIQRKDEMGAQDVDDTLQFFMDEFQDQELVCAITVSETKKRVTVTFRGSTTQKDWIQNIEANTREALNEIYEEGGPNTHSGFLEYLREGGYDGKSATIFVDVNGKQVTRDYHIALLAQRLLAMNKGFALYVTGHSLGGALATLFTFRYASIRKDKKNKSVLPKTTTCISVASPYVGDETFREAFETLEKEGYIRHLRVSNHRDIVPTLPPFSLDLPPKLMKHVGLNMKLFEDGEPKFSYPKATNALQRVWDNSILTNLATPSKLNEHHSMPVYFERLLKANETAQLYDTYLNDLYVEEGPFGSD